MASLPASTREQQIIAAVDPEARLIVTAGPGTGKTHTLIARILCLIEQHGLGSAQEILVLSFSRAAVKEIRDRCRTLGGNLGYLYVSTFDSFATRILSEELPGGDWQTSGYEGRIEAATELLRTNPSAAQKFLPFRHVLVDEIQDLVGVRAEFVRTILEKLTGGFSVFGDPAQGIYNFQLSGDDREAGSAKFYSWLGSHFAGSIVEHTLNVNHRAVSSKISASYHIGDKLRGSDVDGSAVYEQLLEEIEDLPSEGRYEDLPTKTICSSDFNAAILCRNNGQALMVSRCFWSHEKKHHLRRGAVERFLPAWVHAVVVQSNGLSLRNCDFVDKLCSLGFRPEEAAARWRVLKRAEGNLGTRLNISDLNRICRIGRIPDELNETISEPITISTIHRAKGLEFDNVLLAFQKGGAPESEYLAEEARTLYVALTRARRYLGVVELPRLRGLRLDRRTDRWFRGFDRWMTNDFEIKPDDLNRIEPACGVTSRYPRAPEVRDYLNHRVQRGDPVALELVEPCTESTAIYHVVHAGFVIGRTTDDFRNDLLAVIRSRYRSGSLPSQIEGIRVEGIETVFGDPQITVSEGLGESGSWLSARVGGMGVLKYK